MQLKMDNKELIKELKDEKSSLEERLGHVNLALRAFNQDAGARARGNISAAAPRPRTRSTITPEIRTAIENEIKAVLAAFGPCTVKEIYDRGNFPQVSSTSVYRIALDIQRVEVTRRGRSLIFSLR